jgi:hypothetical protein
VVAQSTNGSNQAHGLWQVPGKAGGGRGGGWGGEQMWEVGVQADHSVAGSSRDSQYRSIEWNLPVHSYVLTMPTTRARGRRARSATSKCSQQVSQRRAPLRCRLLWQLLAARLRMAYRRTRACHTGSSAGHAGTRRKAD